MVIPFPTSFITHYNYVTDSSIQRNKALSLYTAESFGHPKIRGFYLVFAALTQKAGIL